MTYRGYEVATVTVYGYSDKPIYRQTFVYKDGELKTAHRSEKRAIAVIDRWARWEQLEDEENEDKQV